MNAQKLCFREKNNFLEDNTYLGAMFYHHGADGPGSLLFVYL